MRPLKLVMQAFGSYGNRTEIDFEKPDQNLFLITGNTGSGKTTIFDVCGDRNGAVCLPDFF